MSVSTQPSRFGVANPSSGHSVISSHLTPIDYDRLEQSILELYALPLSPEELPNRIFEVLSRHIDADNWCYSESNQVTLAVNARMKIPPSINGEVCSKFREIKDRYPIYRYDRSVHSRPVLFTDFWDPSVLHRTELYNDVFRPCRIECGLVSYDCYDNRIVGIAAFRSLRRNFSEKERARFAVLRPHLKFCHQLIRALKLSNSESPRPDELRGLGLTPREAEILHHLSAGRSNVEIAQLAGCQPKTVRIHLHSIFQKLGVENRASAILRAMSFPAERIRRLDSGT
jgi:DNA-binding CsgD family transcriptional regulator